MRVVGLGHVGFATTLVGLGILGLIHGSFTVLWQPVAPWVPAPRTLAYLCAVVSIGSGIGLLWGRTAATAARALLLYLLLWLLAFRVPELFRGLSVDAYWSTCQTAVMMAATWVLYARFATEWDRRRLGFATGERGMFIARALYGLAIIPFGISHFQYLEHTASLVPHWLPAHTAWAVLTGGAFVAAGIAVLFNIYARLAATLSALEMGLLLLLVWIPVVAAGSATPFQWSETIVSWMLAVAGWTVADSYGGVPWLGVGRPERRP